MSHLFFFSSIVVPNSIRVTKLAQIYHGEVDSTDDLNRIASRFENKVFHQANSKEDYLSRISNRLVTLVKIQKQKQLESMASVHQQQIQTGSHVQPFNAVHAIHGASSSISAMPQVESMMSSQGRQSSHEQSLPMTHLGSGLVPNQQMAFPFAPNMHFNFKQEQLEVPGKSHQVSQMQPINITRSNLITPPGLQPSQQIVQSLGTQNPQHMAFQQGSGFNQQQMDRQNYQMMVWQQANATNMHNGHPGGQSSQAGARVGLQSTLKMHEQGALNELIKMQPQPMAQTQQLIAVSQQNSLSPTTGSSGDVDWREEMFQQMKPLKDAYLSELKELNQAVLVPKITQEQFESLPEDKADRQRFKVNLKRKMAVMLKFIQLQKNDIPDNFRGKLPMFLKSVQDLLASYRRIKDRTVDGRCKSQTHHGQHQITNLSGDQFPSGCSASHQNQQEQPMHTQLRENIIRTTPAGCQVISSHLLGAASSCFPENSHRSLQSSPTDKFQECSMTTPSPVIKSAIVNVSSPYASLKFTSPSAITAPGATEAAASSSVSVMSPLPSPVAMPGDVNVVSPCASVNSTVPTAITDSASIQAASPSSSAKSTVPSPSEMSGVIEATAPVTNSGCAPVAFPCPAVQPTSSENDVIFSDLLLQDNSAAASALAVVEETATQAEEDSREVAAIKPIIPASPLQAETADPAEYNKHPGNELPIAKRPIDRLLDAVRASSPAMLTSAANCVYSVLNSNDWAPHRETDEFEDWAFFSEQGGSNTPNKMKRDFDTTSVLSESAPLGTSSASENNAEHGAKRPKTKVEHIISIF
ncbi:hypothetical protein HU200_067765 [Digitaria exilis]|uniref:Mediator complex subunit 15 KIX domain-containing protein n=1 Tax=Digitaria exilis TaxID=1010633 RepID=A0A835DVM1_9POAL|nr:hypothetical protein HU200_067765 [Digitaria exilis]